MMTVQEALTVAADPDDEFDRCLIAMEVLAHHLNSLLTAERSADSVAPTSWEGEKSSLSG